MLTTVGVLLSSSRGMYPRDAVFKRESAAFTVVCSRSTVFAGKMNVMASLCSSEASVLLMVSWLVCITVTRGRTPGNHEKSSLASATDEAISYQHRTRD